ncbi:MAG: D-sedoheptulose 7-phosphate isomerase [candidate division FCPU426 bacterium]
MGRSAGKIKESQQAFIREYFSGSILAALASMEELAPGLEKAAGLIANTIARGGKWLIFGNGGSAADAQHLATELVGRLDKLERRGLPAIALTTDASALTSIANDYGYETVFSRQVEALAKKGDVVLGISTSGNSENVLRGLYTAKKAGCVTLGFSGKGGGKLVKACGLCLTVPTSKDAPSSHVQESHIILGHLLCFLVERELLSRGYFKSKKGN